MVRLAFHFHLARVRVIASSSQEHGSWKMRKKLELKGHVLSFFAQSAPVAVQRFGSSTLGLGDKTLGEEVAHSLVGRSELTGAGDTAAACVASFTWPPLS